MEKIDKAKITQIQGNFLSFFETNSNSKEVSVDSEVGLVTGIFEGVTLFNSSMK